MVEEPISLHRAIQARSFQGPVAVPQIRFDRTELGRILAARDKPKSPWLLIVALALFIVFTWVAVRNLPPIDKPIRWSLVLLAGLVCVPAVTALNALEYRLMAHLAEHHPPRMEILQVTIMGSAANLLPACNSFTDLVEVAWHLAGCAE